MPTLRDHVREALSTREPTESRAHADLKEILARSERRRLDWRWLALPAVALGALVLVFIGSTRRPSPTATLDPKPAPVVAAKSAGFQLYIHVAGEPEDRALAFELTSKGDPR
jgi:hypothetical protein